MQNRMWYRPLLACVLRRIRSRVPFVARTVGNLPFLPRVGHTIHYLLFYETVTDYEQQRIPSRTAHLAHAWAAVERGVLVLGGALANPVDGAVLLFACDSPEPVCEFAAHGPYVVHGLVKKWTV